MRASRLWCVIALAALWSGCVYVDEDGPRLTEDEEPDDILSVPFETGQLAMHTEYDIHRTLRDGQMVAVYDVWIALHEDQHESYCLREQARGAAVWWRAGDDAPRGAAPGPRARALFA